MSETNKFESSVNDNEDMKLKEILLKSKEWFNYLLSKWVIIVVSGIIGISGGFFYATQQKTVYTALLTFALEDEKASSGGLAGAMGLASSLGIDLGSSAGGAFSGANINELMKSRSLIEKALLNTIPNTNDKKTLADYFIEINELNEKWEEKPRLKGLNFSNFSNRSQFTFLQDSILGVLYSMITSNKNGVLNIFQKDKKVSIISVEVKATNEFFAKTFAEVLAKEVSTFYIETKSKKAKNNVAILQKQADSIRSELNAAIMGVATSNDNTFNLNPAQVVRRTPSIKRQIDVQANTAILTQLVTNLELAKVTLLKETPLIQIIDNPILPLPKKKTGKIKLMLLGGILTGFLSVFFIVIRKVYHDILNN